MLYIIRPLHYTYEWNDKKIRTVEFNWQLGEPAYVNCDTKELFRDILEIGAYGPELDYIRKRFNNIPDAPSCKYISWRCEMAQFIYEHLIDAP